ncbi:unnamed protein product, partial [Brassica rapa]
QKNSCEKEYRFGEQKLSFVCVWGKKRLPVRLMAEAIFIKVKKKLGLLRPSDCKEERA